MALGSVGLRRGPMQRQLEMLFEATEAGLARVLCPAKRVRTRFQGKGEKIAFYANAIAYSRARRVALYHILIEKISKLTLFLYISISITYTFHGVSLSYHKEKSNWMRSDQALAFYFSSLILNMNCIKNTNISEILIFLIEKHLFYVKLESNIEIFNFL